MLVFTAIIVFIALSFGIAWARAPRWTKSKRRASDGRAVYEIIGKIDKKDLLLLERIKDCAENLSKQTKQVNQEEPTIWIRMFFSYIIMLLHRSVLAERVSHVQRDTILTLNGEVSDLASRTKVEGLLEQVKYAKWAYPFDSNYENLDGCLREEGYVLLEHKAITAPGKLAHYIAINPSKKVLLLVPRGSCAVSDILTDAVGTIVGRTLHHPEDPKLDRIYTHEGCLIASESLLHQVRPLVERWVVNNDYSLHIVGHSLGAAVGCVLGSMLRAQFEVLNDPARLHIFAFASPPCLNKDASQSMDPFLSTIVWNEDFVPSLSVPNYEFTCKLVAHMDQKEKEYYGKHFYLPRALIASLATTLGWKPLSLPVERQEQIVDHAVAQILALHKERQSSGCLDLFVPGKVVYLWERRHWNEPTGEVKGVTASGDKLPILAMFIPTKSSLSDHFLGAYENGMKQFLGQLDTDEV